jgi:hypothetical protein
MILTVKGFCGIHVTVILGDHIGLFHIRGDLLFGVASGVLAIVNKFVIRINVLEKMALLKVTDTTGGSCGIKEVGEVVCTQI